MITVVLADDHQVVRQGLRALIDEEPDLSVVGEAATGLEAVQLARQLEPDVLVTDMIIPHLNGIEIARQLTQGAARTRVIILSMHSNIAYVLQALANGAVGYVLKESSSADLLTAIREAQSGKRFLSAPLSEQALENYTHKAREIAIDTYETLTTREREIFQMVAEGQTNYQIAFALSISHRTVEVHRANILRKLSLNSTGDLIRYAVKRGNIMAE